VRLEEAGRLKPKQIVVAAMRKLLVACFGVLKTGKPFDPAIAVPARATVTSPIPLFDWKLIIPPSRSVSTSVGARNGGQGGPQARARQSALSLTVASTPTRSARSRAANISIQRLTGNTVSTAIETRLW
jgi:hypothetical protein